MVSRISVDVCVRMCGLPLVGGVHVRMLQVVNHREDKVMHRRWIQATWVLPNVSDDDDDDAS